MSKIKRVMKGGGSTLFPEISINFFCRNVKHELIKANKNRTQIGL